MNELMEDVEIEDLEVCAKEGRKPRHTLSLRVSIDGKKFVIEDSVTTGRQLLDLAGLRPVEEYLLFLFLNDGLLEEIRLEETVDLRRPGIEKFITFRSDRSFRFILDGRQFEWGASDINGITLKKLAGVDPETHGVWLERSNEPDLLVPVREMTSLKGKDVEKFKTGRLFKLCIEGSSFSWPRNIITTEEIAQLGGWDPTQGVIEVDENNNERTLKPGEVIELKSGFSYGKKLCWKRG